MAQVKYCSNGYDENEKIIDSLMKNYLNRSIEMWGREDVILWASVVLIKNKKKMFSPEIKAFMDMDGKKLDRISYDELCQLMGNFNLAHNFTEEREKLKNNYFNKEYIRNELLQYLPKVDIHLDDDDDDIEDVKKSNNVLCVSQRDHYKHISHPSSLPRDNITNNINDTSPPASLLRADLPEYKNYQMLTPLSYGSQLQYSNYQIPQPLLYKSLVECKNTKTPPSLCGNQTNYKNETKSPLKLCQDQTVSINYKNTDQVAEINSMVQPYNYSNNLNNLDVVKEMSKTISSETLPLSDKTGIESTTDSVNNKKKKPGRPRGSTKTQKKEKVGRLWQFLINLIHNKKYNPDVIKWVDEKQGVFQFTDSTKAGELWGEVKGNKNMNFEKMTRAMRHHYKKEYLVSYPKRLLYKFGPLALEWKGVKNSEEGYSLSRPVPATATAPVSAPSLIHQNNLSKILPIEKLNIL